MIKQTALKLLLGADVFSLFRFLNRSKMPILMYHRFSESEEFGKTSRKAFETHLKYLTRHYKIISLTDAVRYLADGEELPNRTAVLTIDDGYRDFYDVAFPILREFDLPATIYVVTGFLDRTCWIWTDKARYLLTETKLDRLSFTIGERFFDEILGDTDSRLALAGKINSELKKLSDSEKDRVLNELANSLSVHLDETPPSAFGPITWDQAREMAAAGIEIGSHTVNHPILTNVDADALTEELSVSRTVLEGQLQTDNLHFCYPNGNVSQRERDAAENAAYASAVTTKIRICERSDDRFLLPRIDAEPEIERLIQSTSGFDAFKAKYRP
ncbi:MAG: polysaccharide deacetylase family protein [Pyrinomonadaceae bacterium]